MTREELDISNIVNIYAPGKVNKTRHGRHNTNIADYVDSAIAGVAGNDLQGVTDKGNITTQPISIGSEQRNLTITAVTADGEFIIEANSLVDDGEEVVNRTFSIVPTINSLDNNNAIFGFDGDQWIILRQKQDEGQAGIVFNKRLKVPDAINDDEAPTLGQVKAAITDASLKSFFITATGTSSIVDVRFENKEVLKIEDQVTRYFSELDFTKTDLASDTVNMENGQQLIPGTKYLITLA